MINKKINKRVNTNAKIGCVNNGKLTGKMAGFRNGQQICVDNKNYQLIPQAPRSRACAGGVGQIRNPRCAIQNSKISSQSEPEPGDEWPPLRNFLDPNSCEVMFSYPSTTNTIIDLKKWGEHEGGRFDRKLAFELYNDEVRAETYFEAMIDRAGLLALNPGFLELFDEAGAKVIDSSSSAGLFLLVGQLSFLFPRLLTYTQREELKVMKLNMLDVRQTYTVQPLVRCIWRLSHTPSSQSKLFEPGFPVDGVNLGYESWFPLLPYAEDTEYLGFRKFNGDLDPNFEDGSTVRLGSQRLLAINTREIYNVIGKQDRKDYSLKLEGIQIIFRSTIEVFDPNRL